MAQQEENKLVSNEAAKILKHDIKNQLSNIYLALEGLKYEVDETSSDIELYIDSITQSAKKIDKLLGSFE